MIQKGLQLIAHFNFQRAPGVSTQNSAPPQGTKKPSAESRFFGSSDFQFVTREDYLPTAGCQSFSLPASPLLSTAAFSKERGEDIKARIRCKGFLIYFLILSFHRPVSRALRRDHHPPGPTRLQPLPRTATFAHGGPGPRSSPFRGNRIVAPTPSACPTPARRADYCETPPPPIAAGTDPVQRPLALQKCSCARPHTWIPAPQTSESFPAH